MCVFSLPSTDKDNDGFLSYNDLYLYCKEHFDLEFEQQLHMAMDNKSDGILTRKTVPSAVALKPLQEPLKELIWQLDDSRRGSLTYEEVRITSATSRRRTRRTR